MPKLNVGSGSRPILGDGWRNADINPACPSLDYVCELDSIPEQDNMFDEVRSIHSIEHIPLGRGRMAIMEWFRVLRAGGKLHVDTPNLLRNATLYVENSDRWMQDLRTLTPDEQAVLKIGGQPIKVLWANFKIFSSDAPHDVHYCNYDAELLMRFFKEAGFVNVHVVALEPSLIVEGVKP